jgi:peptidoglycan/LPS O-acetylase OafA/YrhL
MQLIIYNLMEDKLKKESFNFIHLLRAFAALLIINSHSDKLFPSSLSFLATGGSFGNAIFLFTSGYTLSIGIRNKPNRYLTWLYKRLIRLYPSFLIFTLFSFLFLDEYFFWYDWLFFNGSWFLQAILLYYLIFFPLIRYWNRLLSHFLILNFCIYIIYFMLIPNHSKWVVDVMDNPTRLHWIYYFMPMLLGAIVAGSSPFTKIQKYIHLDKKTYSGSILFILFTISVVLFYLPKVLFTRLSYSGDIQLFYPLLLLLVTYFFYIVSTAATIKLQKFNSQIINTTIVFIANLTLDIYIVHFSVVHAIRDSSIPFPINYLLAFFLIMIFAYILNKVSNKIVQLVLE